MDNECSNECNVSPSNDNVVEGEMQPQPLQQVIHTYTESEKSVLHDTYASGVAAAYKLYKDYSNEHDFGIRRRKASKSKKTGEVTIITLVCNREGFKRPCRYGSRAYHKTTKRTRCTALIRFHLMEDNNYKVVEHRMVHNHPMLSPNKRHLIPSNRNMQAAEVATVSRMSESGVGVATSFRMLAKEVGGEENLQFTKRDVYNHLAKYKNSSYGGCDAKKLLKILSSMQLTDSDFFYEFELDNESHIKSYFYRDGIMKRDYNIFGDLVVFDTTFNTNKWGMLFAPFVGLNHNSKNVMFGIGFIPKEDTESMVWLFTTFRKCMGDKIPDSFMTDQAPAIAYGLKMVYPESKHRLCTWHIEHNARKHMLKYWSQKGFPLSFNYLLKYTNTVAKFDQFWMSFVTKYKCADNKWLKHLHSIRDNWCPAYNKKVFSGGVLSSQKSETTNRSVKRRLAKTETLVGVYKVVSSVISEWRSIENVDDYDSLTGEKPLAYGKVPLLMHARHIYTNAMSTYFERQFVKANECSHKEVENIGNEWYKYYVWRNVDDSITHQVVYNKIRSIIQCTCQMFPEVGILCQHALKVFIVHSVNYIPTDYIKRRWTKEAMCNEEPAIPTTHQPSLTPTVWRSQMSKKFVSLIHSSYCELSARQLVDNTYNDLVEKLKDIIPIASDDIEAHRSKSPNSAPAKLSRPTKTSLAGIEDAHARSSVLDVPPSTQSYPAMQGSAASGSLLDKIKDPTSTNPKYTKTTRHKSIVEIKTKRRKMTWTEMRHNAETIMRAKAQTTLDDYFHPSNGIAAVHPLNPCHPLEFISNNTPASDSPGTPVEDDYFGVTLQPFE